MQGSPLNYTTAYTAYTTALCAREPLRDFELVISGALYSKETQPGNALFLFKVSSCFHTSLQTKLSSIKRGNVSLARHLHGYTFRQ